MDLFSNVIHIKSMKMKSIPLIVFPLIFIGLVFFNPFPNSPLIGKMLAVMLLMGGWWIFECVPIAVTSLLPVFLFPFLGIMDGKDASVQYFNDIIFLFIGGFIISLAMEKWDLHRRIAFRTLLFFGTSHVRILFGFMAAASFLSMWMSNTATAMLMLPIAISVIRELEKIQGREEIKKYGIGLLLGIAYSCSIGGITTLIGTPPNLVFSALFKELHPTLPEVNFSQWTLFALPIYFILITQTALVLYIMHRPSGATRKVPRSYLEDEYRKLGKVNYEQRIVFAVFVLFALSLIFKSSIRIGSISIPGWSQFCHYSSYIKDGNVAIAVAFLLYLLPARTGTSFRMMDWETTLKLPWSIVLLFGGGFALAKGAVDSGFSSWIGNLIASNEGSDTIGLVSVCTIVMAFLTEFTSNVSTAQILLPVASSISDSMMINPLILMVPTTIASSLAFMMPIATPPNAIVFGSGFIKIKEMILPGLIINLIGILITVLVTIYWGGYVFHFSIF